MFSWNYVTLIVLKNYAAWGWCCYEEFWKKVSKKKNNLTLRMSWIFDGFTLVLAHFNFENETELKIFCRLFFVLYKSCHLPHVLIEHSAHVWSVVCFIDTSFSISCQKKTPLIPKCNFFLLETIVSFFFSFFILRWWFRCSCIALSVKVHFIDFRTFVSTFRK